jgi:hypothetical protein
MHHITQWYTFHMKHASFWGLYLLHNSIHLGLYIVGRSPCYLVGRGLARVILGLSRLRPFLVVYKRSGP